MSTGPPRLPLARLPTPLETIRPIGSLHSLQVKRDDLTGIALSGNKIRKLEYLLAEAKAQGAQRVLTCGGIQSNHCRATAVAAAQLGLRSLLFLRAAHRPAPEEPRTGNLKLAEWAGAEIRFISHAEYKVRDQLMAEAAIAGDYIIPEGGSNATGAWGYIRAIDELINQWDTPPSAIICATGSGGTIAGLLIGLKRRELSIPAYGVCVCDDATTFQNAVERISQEATRRWPSLPRVEAKDVTIIDSYVGRGYALSTEEELNDIRTVAQATGLFLDPVYTGKAFRALLNEPGRFGSRPLFVHTGGIFGLLA